MEHRYESKGNIDIRMSMNNVLQDSDTRVQPKLLTVIQFSKNLWSNISLASAGRFFSLRIPAIEGHRGGFRGMNKHRQSSRTEIG